MPKIDELAPATAASDTDEFMVSQGGLARSVTRAQILAGVQPQISVAYGTLLGGASAANGSPEAIAVGANLTLASGTLSATASPYVMSLLPSGNVPTAADSVPIAQIGTNVIVTYAQFLSGLPGVANVDGSQLLVTASGSTAQQRLADFAASTLPRAGATVGVPTYTVAALPLSTIGALAYATNGRKTDEPAGVGTGVLVVGGIDRQWISVMSGTTVLA